MKTFFCQLVLTSFIASVLLVSCAKHKGDIEENIPVSSIKFASPTAGGVYHYGDSIQIQATAISTAVIHGYDLVIKKAADTTVYFATTIHDHNDTLHINQKWKNIITGVSELETQITLHLDHDGHTNTKKVTFKVQ